jgi:hypothetical protein
MHIDKRLALLSILTIDAVQIVGSNGLRDIVSLARCSVGALRNSVLCSR